MKKKTLVLVISSLVVGLTYILPPLIIAQHLQGAEQPFVLNYNIHRDELIYMSRAREIYDGHWPPVDLHFKEQTPTVLNAFPSFIMAQTLKLFHGNPNTAYLAIIFIVPAILFLIFFWLGRYLFDSFGWAVFFAYVGILTPIALRILNFDGA
ncbi:MAG: hypothetical protein HYV54_00440 [Parcubacteria group bacterium]|nr:hypothetical protein [Parcubacteria group bacterium]